MNDYKQKLKALFEEHDEWDPAKSLGNKMEFGEKCDDCDVTGEPLNWCESCGHSICDSCWNRAAEYWGETENSDYCNKCWATNEYT
jgi:hypothetical protein